TAGFASDHIHRMSLQPLTRPDVEELLAGVSGRTVDLADVATEFHQRTDGNPFQIRQLLYQAQQVGALAPAGPGRPPDWDLRALTALEVTASAADSLGRYLD